MRKVSARRLVKDLEFFLGGACLVLGLDVFWWSLASFLQPGNTLGTEPSTPWQIFLLLDPFVVLLWLASGLFVALAGWTRRSSARARFWVALGAFAGTATAFAFLYYFSIVVGCGCDPG